MYLQPVYCHNTKGNMVTRKARQTLKKYLEAKETLEFSKVGNTRMKAMFFDTAAFVNIAGGALGVSSGSSYLSALALGIAGSLCCIAGRLNHQNLKVEKAKKAQAKQELSQSRQELKDIINNTNLVDIMNNYIKHAKHKDSSLTEFILPISKEKAMMIVAYAHTMVGNPVIDWDYAYDKRFEQGDFEGKQWL